MAIPVTLKSASALIFVFACSGSILFSLCGSSGNVSSEATNTGNLLLRQEPSAKRRLNDATLENSESPGHLYGCGGVQLFAHSYGILIAKDLFPDMDSTIYPAHNIDEIRAGGATADDLCIYYVDYCDLNPDDFPGKTLIVSGEAEYRSGVYSLPSGQRTYYLSPKADSYNSLRLPFVSMLLMTRSRLRAPSDKEMMKVMDKNQKPKNNLEHFLLYAVSNCVVFREDAFDALARIREVHYAGSCHGNDQGLEDRKLLSPYNMDRNEGANNNFKIFPNYRFSLVMENQNAEGYISEKILNAFLGGTVPIWYGTTEIFDVFNHKAFIYYDINKPQEALDQITYLEQNREEYLKMLDEPILADGHKTIEKYFTFRDDVGNGSLGRRIRSMLGYESPMYHYSLLEKGDGAGGTENVPKFQ